MAFQIKDFSSIVLSMINHAKAVQDKITDFRIGAPSRTLIEAPAIEIEELYQQMFNGLIESIPTALYRTFKFDKLPAAAAYTVVTFSVPVAPSPDPIVIPKGIVVRVPGGAVGYSTATQVSIAVGQTEVSVMVVADVEGTIGNTISGTITQMDTAIGVVSVTNENDVVSGRDLETELEREDRFKDFILALSRAPLASVEFGAKTAVLTDIDGLVIEYVDKAIVYEPFVSDPEALPGYIECYIFNGENGASQDLINATQEIIDGYIDDSGKKVIGWKAAGVICQVFAVTMVPVSVTVDVTVESGYLLADISPVVDSTIRDYVFNLDINETLIRSELIKRIKLLEGVGDVVITVPASNVPSEYNEKLYINTITVS